MKRAAFVLVAATLHATTYYVGTSGSDSNNSTQAQSASTPWLTIQHSINNMACGDTLIVIANGSYLQNSDAYFPYFPNCGRTTTIQSSALSMFAPVGYRTNPANDSALYGKLQFTNQGWIMQNEVHGGWTVANGGSSLGTSPACSFSSVSPTDGSGASTFTVSSCYGGLQNLANGTQIELEINAASYIGTNTMPTPLVQYQFYYVQSSSGCSSLPCTFQLASTPAGMPVKVNVSGCNSPSCQLASLVMTQPLQVNVGSNTFTIPDSFISCGTGGLNICFQNNAPVTLLSVGLYNFSPQPTIAPPFQANTPYYISSLSGSSFKLSATPGGTPLVLTGAGSGPLTVATMQNPSQWAIRGLEFIPPAGGGLIYGFVVMGAGLENSTLGMTSHIEIDRSYFHDIPSLAAGVKDAIGDNGQFIYIHDSYLSGNRYGEAQAIVGFQAQGPTAVTNNFLEGSGENTFYGGSIGASGLSNGPHTFSGNYYYKPPLWKFSSGTADPSGACWYDATDPNHAGGEWYQNTSGGTWFQCGSSFTWGSVGGPPNYNGLVSVKDMAESKSAHDFTYTGNLFNYVWGAAQSGEVFNNSMEQGGAGAFLRNDHFDIERNLMWHMLGVELNASYCNVLGGNTGCVTQPANYVIRHNLAVLDSNACQLPCGYQMKLFQPVNVWSKVIDHNTIWGADGWGGGYSGTNPLPPVTYFQNNQAPGCSPTQTDGFIFQNNILPGDFIADCGSLGVGPVIGAYSNVSYGGFFTNSTFRNSVLLNGTSADYTGNPGTSAGNSLSGFQFPTSNATIAYVNGTGTPAGDYHLSPSSPYSAANGSATQLSTDGTDLGADIDMINMATSGAAAGTPTWDRQAGLRVAAYSTSVILYYTAPTQDACSATLYSTYVRIPANAVGSIVSDSASYNITDSTRRVLLYGGVSASIPYWGKLACGGGVTLIFSLKTQASGSGTYYFPLQFPAAQVVTYCTSIAMTCGTTLPSSARPLVPVPHNTPIYWRVGSGPIDMLGSP